MYRENADSKVRGAHFQTFFGGTALIRLVVNFLNKPAGQTEDWASSKDQRAWFANVSDAILG